MPHSATVLAVAPPPVILPSGCHGVFNSLVPRDTRLLQNFVDDLSGMLQNFVDDLSGILVVQFNCSGLLLYSCSSTHLCCFGPLFHPFDVAPPTTNQLQFH